MKSITGLFLTAAACSILFFSCSPKIPAQSAGLMQQIAGEGERMHKLNIAFVNRIFNEKTTEIDKFIETEYLPDILKNIHAATDALKPDFATQLDPLVKNLIPKLNARRDSLQRALAGTRDKLVQVLNDDYLVFKTACDAQYNLLVSAIKLNETNKAVFESLTAKISKGKINPAQLETLLDNYLKKGANAAEMVLSLQNGINALIQKP